MPDYEYSDDTDDAIFEYIEIDSDLNFNRIGYTIVAIILPLASITGCIGFIYEFATEPVSNSQIFGGIFFFIITIVLIAMMYFFMKYTWSEFSYQVTRKKIIRIQKFKHYWKLTRPKITNIPYTSIKEIVYFTMRGDGGNREITRTRIITKDRHYWIQISLGSISKQNEFELMAKYILKQSRAYNVPFKYVDLISQKIDVDANLDE